MGKASRDKGARGQSMFANMLRSRDWTVDPITSGVKREDLLAVDPWGQQWAVEVKNCLDITQAHRRQAIEQARKRKLPWLLASKISGASAWLVQRRGKPPVLWHEPEAFKKLL